MTFPVILPRFDSREKTKTREALTMHGFHQERDGCEPLGMVAPAVTQIGRAIRDVLGHSQK